jgi:hypothetical protein
MLFLLLPSSRAGVRDVFSRLNDFAMYKFNMIECVCFRLAHFHLSASVSARAISASLHSNDNIAYRSM